VFNVLKASLSAFASAIYNPNPSSPLGYNSIVESIVGKMGLVGEQNVMNHMGVRINPTA
jgi:hypothetical protein